MTPREIRTQRLLLRPWREADLAAYAALNADGEVRRWFPDTLDASASDAQARRLQDHIVARGCGFWAVEVPGAAPFVGFMGLQHVALAVPFAPAIEAGWRLARSRWGRGYATEAARAALRFGFGSLDLAEIVAFTVVGNAASRAVMERIGMHYQPAEDFDHPDLPADSPQRRHVLYRARRAG